MNETDRQKYQKWIQDNYPTQIHAMGKCKQACERMVEAFPELIITNGFIDMVSSTKEILHWWCKTQDNEIVDPTVHQYETGGIFEYGEIDDSHPARNYPRVKCMNCGQYYYKTPELKEIMHNKKCEQEFCECLSEDF